MLEAICSHLHNWFTDPADVCEGEWTIENGAIDLRGVVQTGQYFRVVGSTFNDGVYQYPASELANETFTGEIWPMKVPRAVIALSDEIAAWQAQYGATMASPYQSESVIGVYSYAKGVGSYARGGNGNSASNADAWQSVFRSRLNQWRKLA